MSAEFEQHLTQLKKQNQDEINRLVMSNMLTTATVLSEQIAGKFKTSPEEDPVSAFKDAVDKLAASLEARSSVDSHPTVSTHEGTVSHLSI